MDKNKNRTDLLAAGRKKLQQFRQKKDNKGSSSHGKSSKKSGKSEQHEADADAASAADNPTASPHVPEGDVGFIDSSMSHSVKDTVAPDIDVLTIDRLSVPVPPETGVGEIRLAYDTKLPPEDSGAGEAGLALSVGKDRDVDSSGPNGGESIQTVQSEVARVTSFGTLDIPVSEGDSIHANMSVPVDLSAPIAAVDSVEGDVVAVETESTNTEEERELLPSQQHFPDTSLIHAREDQVTDVGTMQEADCLGSKQLDRSGGIELEEDGRLALSQLAESAETLAGAVSRASTMQESTWEAERTGGADDVSASAVAGNKSEAFSGAPKIDGFSAVSPEVTDHQREDVMKSSSNEEKTEILSISGEFGSYQVVEIQADTTDRTYYEGSKQNHLPDGSFISEGENCMKPLGTKMVNLFGGWTVSPGEDVSSISLSQLAEVVKGLDEDEFRFLLKSSGSASKAGLGDTGSLIVPEYGFADVLETFKEQLYLTNVAKDFFHLQLTEQSNLQTEFDHQRHQLDDEISMLSASLNEVHERNKSLAGKLAQCQSELQAVSSGREELQNQFHAAKAEVEEFSSKAFEFQVKLERSQGDLSSLSLELADCKDLVVALQVENANLSGSLTSVTEERKKLQGEKEYFVCYNEKLSSELAELKGLVSVVQVENANLGEIIASVTEERKNLEEEKEYFVHENEKLSTELANCKGLVAAVQVENTNLSGNLASVIEERKKLEEGKEYFIREHEKLLSELTECKGLVADVQVEKANLSGSLASVTEERKKLEEEKEYLANENEGLTSELRVHRELLSIADAEKLQLEADLRELNLRFEQPTEENVFINSSLDIHRAKITEINNRQIQLSSQSREANNQFESTDVPGSGCENDSHKAPWKIDDEVSSPVLEKPLSDGIAGGLPLKHPERDVYDDSFGFVVLKGHLEEVEKIMQKLEKAIEGMHSHSTSRSGGKVAAPAVSKLIQAFESKTNLDDHEIEEKPLSEDRSFADPFMLSKEQIGSLRRMLKELGLDAENASQLFSGERDGRKLANVEFGELKVQYEAMEEHTNNLESMNIQLEVQYEAIKQHVCLIQARNSELEILYEALKQHDIDLHAENIELGKKLSDFQSRIGELQSQLFEMQQSSNEMASSICGQIENLEKEAAEKALELDQEWNSAVAQIVEAVGKLDAFIGRIFTNSISTGTHIDSDVANRVASSVNAATKVIEDLQEKLEFFRADHEAISSLYKDMNEKFDDLHGKNELAIGTLRKIYADLRKLVNDSCGYVEESEINSQNEEFLEPSHFCNYETLIEQLGNFLGERLLLESENNKLNLDLMSRKSDMEELNKRCLDWNAILKLVDDVEGAVKLEDVKIDSDTPPVSRLEYFVSFLLQKYKEADEQVNLSREEFGSKVMELSELQEKIHQLNSLNLQRENEVISLKESLSKAEEALVAVRSELQEKLTELEQSEQRVSSVREKLSIAVAKGKGLIVQRDSLKQSFAEASNELERCSQELQLKDARLREVEAKVKTYSEAGERVEALESELSYIRNSATALRESFLLKDSVLQRIEEILEDLELPEHFHSRDIIEKVDWLARSVTGNSLPLTDWDQKSSVEGGSYSDAGFVVMDAWKEDMQPNSNPSDDLRRKYDEIQSKFYGLAEQNEMLEQSLMERNNLVQRWEQVLDKINMPTQLRSAEPEDRIEWLGSALSEAHHHVHSLQQKIDSLETYCASVTSDLEDSQRRLSDVEVALQMVVHEKERLSESLEILAHDHEKLSERAVQFEVENDKLQNEITSLQGKLVEKISNEEHSHRIEAEIRRLQDLASDALQDPGTIDLVSGGSSIECLEGLLRKLIETHASLSLGKPVLGDAVGEHLTEKADAALDEPRNRDIQDAEEPVVVLKKELEEALGDLMHVKEERDSYMDKHQSLVCEVEALNRKREELQEHLNLEEQKSVSLREKLNVAVRKGKSLVQQRDSLKQTIEEMSIEVEHLKSEINLRENALTGYEQRIKDLSTYQERVVALESESLFLRNRLTETEHYLQEKAHALSMILRTLGDIDVGGEFSISDPVEKLEQIGKLCRDLHAAVASSEQESRKSKRAAELLLAELNEVQERNDGLQEELAKAGSELLELSKERDMAEAAKLEALSCLEKSSTVDSEKRKNQYAEFMALQSGVDELRTGFFDINNLLADVFSKDLEFLHNLEDGLESCLKRSDATNVVGMPFISAQGGITSDSENKQKVLVRDFWSDSKMQDHFNENAEIEVCSFVGNLLQEFTTEIGALKEKLHKHSISLHEEASSLYKVMEIVHREMASQNESFESMKRDIFRLELIKEEKDKEIVVLRGNIALLYEACTSSITEIENRKAHLGENNVAAGDPGTNLKFVTSAGQSLLSSEEHVQTMADSLFMAVKDFASIQANIIEASQMEMKNTVVNLQKELQEKDIQKNRICMELVSQIKEAEAAATTSSLDLQSAKTQVHNLEEEQNLLQQRVKELQDGETISMELQERIKTLTDVLAAKDQEIESLMQALDEEETQMEDLTNKIEELEKIVHQKNLDLENLEASRSKALKKLSITVSKFDELHHLSASLLGEVEKLQSQLQDRDAEISFLRQEVTRCTNDVLVASQTSSKRNSDEIHELLTWLDMMISQVRVHDVHLDDQKRSQVHEYKEILQKQITSIISELEDLRVAAQSGDALLQVERSRVEELIRKGETLENSLYEKESQLKLLQGVGDSRQASSTTSEILEVEPVMNKRTVPGTSIAPQVRSLRKVNNDQVAIAIDMDHGSSRLEDEDDDKVHGFKSLTTSRIVPRFTRPVTNMIDGLWVSCDRALMRQPALRLGIIIYWAILHALLANFVV
ncbi:hypothetical protein L1049_018024 [Liquidambar formosana]|uniref:Uncharacterized protein n=1 Tax=Liquidambar formosana TaxID=63359 RepID=A0AAP0NKE3_LIQFO